MATALARGGGGGSVSSRALLLRAWAALIVAAGCFAPSLAFAANLEPRTVKAFNHYIQALEARLDRQERSPNTFLDVQKQPSAPRADAYALLKHGGVYIEQLHERNSLGHPIHIPGGWIHHWLGAVYVPGASVAEALAVLNDYNNFQEYYRPEIARSRILSQTGRGAKVYLQFYKKTVVTVTLDMNQDTLYGELDPDHAFVRTHSTRIAQVENAGTPNEHDDPPGHDSGYIWRMNTYWHIANYNHGIILESETVALSRGIPFGLGWFIRPLAAHIAEATVSETMTATRGAILKRIAEDRMKEPAAK